MADIYPDSDFDTGEFNLSLEWLHASLRQSMQAMLDAYSERIPVALLSSCSTLPQTTVSYKVAGLPDDLYRPSDAQAPTPSTPVDTVIGDLAAGRVVPRDRMRLGKALGEANAKADGHKAGEDEAFKRIARLA